MLKKSLFAIAVVAMPSFALANNTIQFQGEVTDQTCEVTVNGNSNSPVVLLPTVTREVLNTASTAGETPFTIGLSGCSVSDQPLEIMTVFVGNNVTQNGNLGNTGGTATDVELQILDEVGGAVVDLQNGTAVKVEGLVLEAGAQATEHDFAVQYFTPTNQASVGSVFGSLQYAISYQ